MTNRITIVGPITPAISGVKYLYSLAPASEIVPGSVRWEVKNGAQLIVKPTVIDAIPLTFHKASSGNVYSMTANYRLRSNPETEQQAFIFIAPKMGPPAVVETAWLDANFQNIPPSRIMEYLDDVYLTVQTVNIPPGETVYVQIKEKEATGGRDVGTSMPAQVNEAGIARLRVTSQLLLDFAQELNGKDWINDIWHEYYAQIIYYGRDRQDIKLNITIKEKTKILSVMNKAGRTVEERNKTKPAAVDTEDVNAEKIPVKIKINVYFDGTMGNKYNVELFEKDLRSRVEGMPENMLEEDIENCKWVLKDDQPEKGKILKDYAGGDESTSSYKQTLTSITNLYDLDLFDEKDSREVKIYIEGVGSIPYGEDDVLWGAGAGWTKGIDSKVTKAMAEILVKVRNAIDIEEECVEEVTICVIGFSRGAATTRYFVSLRERVAMSALTSTVNVIFKFAGLFDTVCSVQTLPLGKSNVERYNLKIGANAQKVVQLAAGDEYRKKFPLTDISSSIGAGVGYEVTLPGDHSDIGGGHKNYHLVKNKQGVEVPVSGLIENMYEPTSFVNKLIEQGWYSEKDIIKRDKMYIPQGPNHPPRYVDYTSVERIVWNSYRYIPLGIMIDFAAKYGEIPFDKGLQEENYSVKSPLLLSIKNTLHNFAISNDGAHSVSAYELIQGQYLKQLRNRYIHLSARKEGGQSGIVALMSAGGRYKKGKPDRETIEG